MLFRSKPERVIGLKSHSDINGLTILLQISDIEDLQIKKDGHIRGMRQIIHNLLCRCVFDSMMTKIDFY